MFDGRRVIFSNPANDTDFVSFVSSAAEGAETPERLEAVLRSRYRAAQVRARVLDGELSVVWYVYREGRWVSGRGDKEGGKDGE